jgi:membrane-associated phospholipid phosphatase
MRPLLAFCLLLGLAIALSVLAGRYDTLPGDTRIAAWAQARPFPGERLSAFVRAVTTTEVTLAAGAGAVLALALLGRRREAVLLGAGLVALPLLQAGLKELVDRPRPAGPLVELRAGFTSPSFPAGHVMSPTYLYGFLLFLSLRDGAAGALRVAAGAWSAFVLLFAAPPNVWLGVHWPSDVLGGWAWALVLLLPLLYLRERLRRPAGG